MTEPGSGGGSKFDAEALQVLYSPEQVALHLPIAGPTSRILAYAIDYVLIQLFGSGGGLYSQYMTLTVSGNDIYSNAASFGGGGLYVQHGLSATLSANHVYSNHANGIEVEVSSNLLVRDNDIYDNGDGRAALSVHTFDNAQLLDNQLHGNRGLADGVPRYWRWRLLLPSDGLDSP